MLRLTLTMTSSMQVTFACCFLLLVTCLRMDLGPPRAANEAAPRSHPGSDSDSKLTLGRPAIDLEISDQELIQVATNYSTKEIAEHFGVSTRYRLLAYYSSSFLYSTIQRRLARAGFRRPVLDNEAVDTLVSQHRSRLPRSGIRLLLGSIRATGVSIGVWSVVHLFSLSPFG
jgi:hypothetical protein